ncbi:MAG: hypothetical protein GY853_10135 [PVC group bacterium]|nr:hypothetical protein [PVC group bacterium]
MINRSLKILSEKFEEMVELFDDKDWKFYKFGRGGPYKRTLTKIQEMSNEHDKIIFKFFGAYEETASFNKLIVLCLRNETPKEMHKHIDNFRRQIKRMRKTF